MDRQALAAALPGVLLDPAEAVRMDVHGSRHAAVLAPLSLDPADRPHLIFTRRRHDLSRHPGEISFPGGRRDEGEELLATALREAHEEIGLPPDAVEVLGALVPTATFVSDYAVYPFVGIVDPDFEWVVEAREVAEVLELPIAAVAAGHRRRRLLRRGIPVRTDVYEVGDHLIWGATARMVADLLRRIGPLLGWPPTRPSRSAR